MLFNLKPMRVIGLFAIVGGVAFTMPVPPEAAGLPPVINANAWGILPLQATRNAMN